MQNIGEQLGEFYAEWGRQIAILCDSNRTFKDRLAALRWLDQAVGGPPTAADDLERVAAELREAQ